MQSFPHLAILASPRLEVRRLPKVRLPKVRLPKGSAAFEGTAGDLTEQAATPDAAPAAAAAASQPSAAAQVVLTETPEGAAVEVDAHGTHSTFSPTTTTDTTRPVDF